jgi:hypothetical protein
MQVTEIEQPLLLGPFSAMALKGPTAKWQASAIFTYAIVTPEALALTMCVATRAIWFDAPDTDRAMAALTMNVLVALIGAPVLMLLKGH